MYTTNAGYLAAACNYNRIIDTQGTLMAANINNVVLTTEEIVDYKITYSSVAGKMFMPGSFVATRFELSLNAQSDKISSIDFKAAGITKFVMRSYITNPETNAKTQVPLGHFYPDKEGISVGSDGYISVEATSIPPELYEKFDSSSLTLPCTISSAITQLRTLTGITLKTPSTTDFPNLSVQLTETFSLVSTYREAFMYIAEILGAYVFFNRSGQLQFGKLYNSLVDLGCTLDDNYLFSVSRQESSVKPFQIISIKENKDDVGVSIEVPDVSTACEYSILNNPLTYGHPEDFLAGLVAPTSFSEFFPAKISFQGRPDIDVGDVLTYVHQGLTYTLPVCTHTFEYNGGFKTTVESIGVDSLLVSSTDSDEKTQITALKQQINTFLRDLEQTKSELVDINGNVSNISTLLQTAEELLTRVSSIEGDIEKMSSWEQTAETLRLSIATVDKSVRETQDTVSENYNTLLSYFDFQADGLTIGINNSNIKLKLSNDKIQFLKDGVTEVAYFSEGKLYVTDAHFLSSLILGNFEFVPRANGNLSLRRRG